MSIARRMYSRPPSSTPSSGTSSHHRRTVRGSRPVSLPVSGTVNSSDVMFGPRFRCIFSQNGTKFVSFYGSPTGHDMEYPEIDLDLSGMERGDHRWPGLRLGRVRVLEGRVWEMGGELGVQTDVHPDFGWPARSINQKEGRFNTWEEAGGRWLTGAPDLLRDFVGLSDPTRTRPRLTRFLNKYGALPMCLHGEARAHEIEASARCTGPYPPWHPVTHYQRFAEEAAALLTAAAALHKGERAPESVWKVVQRTYTNNEDGQRPNSLETGKAIISFFALPQWMDRGGLGLRLDWEHGDSPNLFLGSLQMNLWSALARALLFAVLGRSRFERCSHCGDLIPLEGGGRKRRDGVRAWCRKAVCQREKTRLSSEKHRRSRRS